MSKKLSQKAARQEAYELGLSGAKRIQYCNFEENALSKNPKIKPSRLLSNYELGLYCREIIYNDPNNLAIIVICEWLSGFGK